MAGKKKKANDFIQINRLMGKPDGRSPFHQMVCLTNGLEVLRVTKENAKEFLMKKIVEKNKEKLKAAEIQGYEVDYAKNTITKPIEGWMYTDKRTYKQYIDSKKPNSKIPFPSFQITKKRIKAGKEVEIKSLKNIYHHPKTV